MRRLALLALLVAGSTAAQTAPLRLDRRLTAGTTYRLVWEERACGDSVVVRSLEASLTIAEVDRRGRATAIDVVVTGSVDPDPSGAAAGTALSFSRLAPALARRSHSDWGGPSPPDGGTTRAYLASIVLPVLFADRLDAAVGSRRARAVGDTWSHRGLSRREGLPIHRYRLPGTGRIEAREELDGLAVTHVVLVGRAPERVPLWEGEYTSYAEDVAETLELWVPDDPSLPYPHATLRRERVVVSTTTETTRSASAWCDEIRLTR